MPQTEYDPRWDEPANLTDVRGFGSAARPTDGCPWFWPTAARVPYN